MKSEEEKKLDKVLDEYFDKFGENYPFVITSMASTDEIIADVRKYIEKGEPKPEPEYDEDVDY